MYNPAKNPNASNQNKNMKYSVSNLHPQFELNEMEAKFYKSILKQQADDNPFTFVRRKDTDATIFKVNHLRVSINEAKKIKEFMTINIHKGHKEFIIDLSNCEFMDSTFLGAIILVTKKLLKENGNVILVAMPEKLKVLHALRELNKVFKIAATVDEAVEELNSK